ncbi:PGF-CTERM sorting domain-containing protein [Salinadaptatus halalkaliphilus]|uniref:PGF-CTERM sorting domain-containing protein n=1 Tax=Salinadaptatus halalkaliphilus TaxID=2419781 RepID=A0A4S3TQH4_9EURY|nr:BGTF surface domain-containing protein [Salinadaptatus halalkaliphilus]THE65533.1 PGF-CTERM sorting domain-containing protein [Salinadaptatus halalkaliphilus]
MTHERTYRETGRALVLAAMMVCSVVAMSAAFAGGATASDEVSYTVDGEDRTLVFQGQTVVASGGSDGGIDDDEVYDLREVTDTSGGEVDGTSFVSELNPENGDIEIETADLEDGNYFLEGPGIDTSTVATSDTFEVVTQDLTVELEDEAVTDGGQDAFTDLDIDSNRGTYSLNVSADGDLDDEELFGIFSDDGEYDEITTQDADELDVGATYGEFNAGVYDEDEDDADETIVLVDLDDREHALNFTDIDDGEYDLEFEVVDSDAADSVSVEVGAEDLDAEFDQSVYTQSAGDVVEFTIDLEDTDDAYVQFGDEDAGYVDILYVEDDSDSGDVTVQVNTRTAGAPNTATEDVFHSEDDIVQSLVHDGGDEVEQAAFYDDAVDSSNALEGGFSEYLEELDLLSDGDEPDEQLTRPLQAADYNVAVNGNENFIVDADGDSELDDELALATLDLTTPTIESVTTSTAPSDDADEHELDELREIATERTEIAADDQLIVAAETGGLTGALLAQEGDWDALEDGFAADSLYELTENDGEGISFEVEADDATGNQDPTTLVLENADDDDVYVFVDTDTGALYVVADTSSSSAFDGSLEDGMEFTATLEYETDDDERYAFGDGAFDGGADGDAEAAYPYFDADSDEAVSTDVTIVDPAVSFDNLDADETVQLEAGEIVVTGETNVAPGTTADVRIGHVSGADNTFLHTADAAIDADGVFESNEIDLSDREVDENATLEFRAGGSTIGDADGIFVDALEDDDADETDDEPEETDDEPEETDDEPVETDDGTDDPATGDDSVPGFGVAVAVVALLAAAMIALRRQ